MLSWSLLAHHTLIPFLLSNEFFGFPETDDLLANVITVADPVVAVLEGIDC